MPKNIKKNRNYRLTSRRQSRSRRIDVGRQWRDGLLDEDAPQIARWSKELKEAKPRTVKEEGYQSAELEGTVIEVNRRTCCILSLDGEKFSCHLPTNLDLSRYSSVAAGDNVLFSPEIGRSGLITKVLPRKNKLSRCGPSDRKHKELILAANVDAVLIVFAFCEPEFRGWLLDKYLVRLVKADLPPIICMNKFDLFTREPQEIQHLKKMGYKIIFCSAKNGYGMDQLLHAIERKKTVITGPSGSGKSSIIRFYDPGLTIKIGEIRKSDGTGRHVTSRSHCYPVMNDTWLIDTPGLRDMPLDDVTGEDVSRGFKEFEEPAGRCRFRNCQHLNEEGCAVREAVIQKYIPKFRYQSYLRIRNEI